ncbi:MAG: hypothetical protein Q9187_008813 [Circinaria calcarea]
MGKKKRGHPDIEEILARPWCYYCERDFDDQKVLINHQKAKHFKCERCGRRLNTAGGLSVHMTQVHKETLTTIENALPNRSNLDVEIFGMEGIPADVVQSHNQRVLSQLAQAEAERRAATGNPGPGGTGAGGVKKPKFESPSDLKQRLAAHKAKKAVEEAAGISSGDITPIGAGQGSQSPAVGPSPVYAGSPPYPQQQMPYGGARNSTYSSFPQPYGQPNGPYQQQPPFGQQSPGFHSPGPQFAGHQAFAPLQQYPPPINQNFAPPNQNFAPPNQSFAPPNQNFPPPNQSFPPPNQSFAPPNQNFGPPQNQNFGPPQNQGFVPPNQNFVPPQFQNGPPRFGAGSPPIPFHSQGHFQPPRTQTPPQNGPSLQRTGSLPPAPGLPRRPSFGAPPVNAFQMQQLHQGQLPAASTPASYSTQPSHSQHQHGGFDPAQSARDSQNHQFPNNTNNGPEAGPLAAQHVRSSNAPSVTDTKSAPVNDRSKVAPDPEAQAEAKFERHPTEKKGKKDKDKAIRLVYSDEEISPEEKMAKLPRYAFVPDGRGETVLGDATTAAVTGAVRGGDDVMVESG